MPKVGVIGSLVWDVIHGRDPARAPVEEWGGIAYALASLDASLPPEWEVVPLIKVGRDMAERAGTFLRSLARPLPQARFIEVPTPNNRVILQYAANERRAERMAGGVPGWTWPELGPMIHDLDALYLNFISGFELCLGTALALRQGFDGPIYADFHSLMLGMHQDGVRVLRPLPEALTWFQCFDIVQLNEDEMRQLSPEPLGMAADAIGVGVSLVVVTLGERGIAYVATPGFASLADRRHPRLHGRPIQSQLMQATAVPDPDPTGCGDVFGAATFARLLAGAPLVDALRIGIGYGEKNASFRGATDLAPRLRGELLEAPCES